MAAVDMTTLLQREGFPDISVRTKVRSTQVSSALLLRSFSSLRSCLPLSRPHRSNLQLTFRYTSTSLRASIPSTTWVLPSPTLLSYSHYPQNFPHPCEPLIVKN